ncbi:hypothetical protein HRH59_14545 [Rheinheimera sp. YQF-2]|uniref:Uncharacterized protein n=1 Tax=Rheinheimera lutimaris TaxID=2740584 RepID=A0A7Y5EIQ5_9GAMM|nr:hypothetical protein [Rheinheimera lutimaris]NRQ43770.1 hypothetical protein [Rheinheimera lutimaris]
MNTIQYIKDWISNKESFSFFLPDGPQGRPFDKQYLIDGVIENQNGVTIKMSGGIEFEFEGEVQYRDEFCNLIVNGFSVLRYKVNGVVNSEYLEGEFCLNGF